MRAGYRAMALPGRARSSDRPEGIAGNGDSLDPTLGPQELSAMALRTPMRPYTRDDTNPPSPAG
jgi:hypothetical protein